MRDVTSASLLHPTSSHQEFLSCSFLDMFGTPLRNIELNLDQGRTLYIAVSSQKTHPFLQNCPDHIPPARLWSF